MALSLSHEAKQLISSADNGKNTSLFHLKNSQMQCTWEIPLISSANDLQRLTALEAGKCCKCGLLQNMPLFFKVMERNNPYQKQMT